MPTKKQTKLNVSVSFINSCKYSYEDLIKKTIELKAVENQNLINDFNLTFNPQQETKRIRQKKLNEIYAKKQFFINEIKKLEEQQPDIELATN